MSMFRPAAEIGSSDSDSSPEASDHEVVTKKEAKSETQPVEDGKLPIPEDGGTDDSSTQDLLAADTDGHSNIMTSALLEFYCLTRAADLLNKQHGSRNRYTRESPEVQFLGKKLYSHKSKFLSAHGVLADGIEDDEWGSTRQYYRDNLDALGLSALEGLDIGDTGGKPAIGGTGDLVVASKTSRSAAQPTQKSVPGLRVEGHEVGPLDFRGHHGAERGIPALEDFRLDPRRIPRPLLPLTGSSPTSFPLFDVKSTPSNATMSRYAMEFAEIQIVGRGSFGEVYHVKNHIDGQDYAVKKIPLSQRRLEQLQCGNENQLENIMKEIRTLARLEHANVVRYYGAWLEQTNFPRIPFASQDPGELDDEETHDSEANEPSGVNSFGIVFEHSQAEQPSSIGDGSIDRRSATDSTVHSLEKILSRSSEDDVESIPREFSEQTYSQLSTFGASDGDIFTDGFSNDRSQLQLQRRHRNGEAVPAVVLHIQMSLHPIPLSSYLSQQQTNDTHTLLRRHCYHLIPSLKLILSIVSGVDYLHSKGIIHRDLKPANIFLSCAEDRNFTECQMCKARLGACSKFCHPRIGDFGLVADISHMNDSSPGTPIGSTLPKLNRVVGTEFYCPPFFRTNGLSGPEPAGPSSEEYFDYSIDESLDVYALGVILFELVYRIGTKMERQMVLTGLTRGSQRPTPTGLVRERPVFPEDFERKVDRGSTALPSGESVAESLKTCIRGMLELQPHRRWRCCDVQRYLTGLLNIAEQSFV